MADLIAELTGELSGNQLTVRNVQIDHLTTADDGSGQAMVSFETVNEDAQADTETPEFDKHDASADGFVFGDERTDEDTPASGGSKGPWIVGETEMTHGELQETVSKLCEAGEISEYPGNGGDQLAGALRDHKLSEEVSEMPVNDENDDQYPETNDDGISYRVSDTDTKWYKVGDDEMTHNQLQGDVKTANYPDSPTVANLIEAYKNQESTEETHETTEKDDSVEANTAYTGKGQPSVSWLENHGVDAGQGETARRFRKHQGVCPVAGCEYGVNKQDTTCFKHSEDDIGSETMEVTYEDEEDRGDEVTKVAKMFGVSPKVAEEAVEAKAEGHFGDTKTAIDHFDN
jgi:hypothetical protein